MIWRATLGLTTTFALLLSGCYGDAESFIVAKAKQDCKRLASCNASFFEDAYDGDMNECRAAQEDIVEAAYDLLNIFGDYDPEEGRKCVSATRANRNDCSDAGDDEISDSCDRVVN